MRSRAISLAAILVPGPALAQTCPGALEALAPAAHIGPRLEIELTDGRLLRQIGLAPFAPRDSAARTQAAATALLDHVQEEPIQAPSPLPAEDRWGRIAGHLHARGESLGLWLAANGLTRVAPRFPDPCGPLLLKAESKAREGGLGLWKDPYYSVLAAADPVALGARSGEFVIVEGRILRVGQTSARFYLDFGPARGVDLSVTVLKSFAKAFSAAGTDLAGLGGRRALVRGTLEHRPGPTIEISGPFALETIGR